MQADGEGAGVIVTQGRVKVSGLNSEIHAGQQLAVGRKVVNDAPRASYVLDWTRELMEAAQSPLVPASNYAGGALVAVDPSGQEVRLTLRKFHIDVHIEDGFARTTIDQTYFNNETGRLEGTFYFPLPPDASLSRLAMYVEDGADSKLMEGGMAERDHARNVFETIMHQRRDPALLEWVDGSTFKMRVFPLEGRKEKRVLLSYTQSLSSLYGTMQYRFPAGHNMELVRDWSFQAKVVGKRDISRLHSPQVMVSEVRASGIGSQGTVHSRVHPEMKFTGRAIDTIATIDCAECQTQPRRRADAQANRCVGKIAFAGVRPGRPALSDAEMAAGFGAERSGGAVNAKRSGPRDWVILFETSANRDPLLARAQIDIVKTLPRKRRA